jgi:hypothetical protein
MGWLLLGLALGSCYREQFYTGTDIRLRFSVDTLRFDTVFTTVGSATRYFKVFNDFPDAVRINSIKLTKGLSSSFRLNVDGYPAPGKELQNIEIGPQDSIYLFLEVTVQPNQPLSVSPFVIEESIQFTINGNTQSVLLEAWGQNANYIPSTNSAGGIAILTCGLQDVVWDDKKPYVIYGVLVIDSCNLRLPEGARVYVHGGLVRTPASIYNDGIIYVLDRGKLLVEGSKEKPVIFTTDRLESELREEWGAWSGIRFGSGSTGNKINYAEIKSAFVGIWADSASEVTVRNTRVFNSASSGILGIHSRVVVENCLFYSNGGHGIQFAYGGNYRVDYCTLANYGNDAEALSMNNAILRSQDPIRYEVNALFASINNCIVYGSGQDELDLIDLSNKDPFKFQTSFSHCYIKAEELLKPDQFPKFFEQCQGCIRAKTSDTVFLNSEKFDFRLDTNSVVNGKARPLDNLPLDILGVKRETTSPDMGCFELKL